MTLRNIQKLLSHLLFLIITFENGSIIGLIIAMINGISLHNFTLR